MEARQHGHPLRPHELPGESQIVALLTARSLGQRNPGQATVALSLNTWVAAQVTATANMAVCRDSSSVAGAALAPKTIDIHRRETYGIAYVLEATHDHHHRDRSSQTSLRPLG